MFFKPNLLRGNANFLPPPLLLLMYVCRQLDNEPAESAIKVASFSGQISRRTQSFFKRAKTLKKSNFFQILWGAQQADTPL